MAKAHDFLVPPVLSQDFRRQLHVRIQKFCGAIVREYGSRRLWYSVSGS